MGSLWEATKEVMAILVVVYIVSILAIPAAFVGLLTVGGVTTYFVGATGTAPETVKTEIILTSIAVIAIAALLAYAVNKR